MYIVTIRNAYAQEWSDNNPVLANGELGYVVDQQVIKVGDGVTAWNDLPAAIAPSGP